MANVRNPRFFIVDDDPMARMRYQRHLMSLGYDNNHLFENGEDCIEKLYLQPDVIFLDYEMWPSNGIEVLHKVKKYDPNIHILFISAKKDTEIAISAIMSGAFDYVVKGEKDLDNISSMVNKILTIREFYAKLRDVNIA